MKYSLRLSILCLATASHSIFAASIFEDDFNSGLSNWTVYGNTTTDSSHVIDGLSAYFKETGSLEKDISLSGYTNIDINYQMAARLLESADHCIAEYSTDGGNNFTELSRLSNGQDDGSYNVYQHAISDTTSIKLRFRADTGGADHCYVENVKVTGTAGQASNDPQIDLVSSVNFGTVNVGNTSSQNLNVSNSGNDLLSIQSVQVSGSQFNITSDSCSSAQLAVGANCTISLDFTPTAIGNFNGTLSIDSNDPVSPTLVTNVSGFGSDSSAYVEDYQPLSGSGNVSRSQLTHAQLKTSSEITAKVSMGAFALPSEAAQPEHSFEGTLTLISPATAGIGQFTEIKDTFRYTGNADDPRKHLPDFSFEFVQSGTHIIPKQRGINLGSHEYWEYILEPGRVWKENSDNGDSRAVIPFSLLQKNSNCIHNGLMSFTFNNTSVSQVYYQISSETCLYYQFDTWGSTQATYSPQAVSDALAIKQAHQAYESSKLEVRPISQLASDHPSANLNVENIASASEVTPANMTVYGVYYQGVHYRGGCETRDGTHPYCDRVRTPSYSTAKTAFAGTASMRLEQMYPGYMNSNLTSLVPETNNDPENDWRNVTPNHALDMATGNYRLSSSSMSDESSIANDNGFFLVLDHQSKLDYSISRYPRASAPGSLFIYHTTDTYIATVAAQNYIKSQKGSQYDIFNDVLVADIWQPLGIDLGSQDTRRTYDSKGMPFGGFGLTFLSDDIIKLSKFTAIDEGKISGQQLLDASELSIALFEDPTSPPLPTTIDRKYYANSMWGKSFEFTPGCEVIIPFMSGYGGIQFVMMPNDVIYYYVSDNDEFLWDSTAIELNKLDPICM